MTESPRGSAQKLALYLEQAALIRGVGTPETSQYPPLRALLAAIGGELKPPVDAVSQLRDTGAGVPDFGLYTKEQLKRIKGGAKKNPARGAAEEKPDRGAVEVKPPAHDLDELIRSEQTARYAREYGTVLATNLRQFAVVEFAGGEVKEFARCDLAAGEKEFWEKAKTPKKTADALGGPVCEFLRRALSHKAPITSAKEVAAVLASYARQALGVLQGGDENALRHLRGELEKALSMKFEPGDGARFFLSTLSQTIFYGLFSAWMETPGKSFDWKSAAHSVKTPVMRALFAEITNPDRLGRLGLAKLLDEATASLARVSEKEKLFGGMDAGKTIQYFYEPFLADFDPELRKQLGVWYTPPEIVRYMVERADRVLREELQIPEGLAAGNVHILDPCGGTGAFVAETLRRIRKTFGELGYGDAAAQKAKEAAIQRVFGFEILSASYIVAHWQIGALLNEMGAPLKEGERAAVYLTNSLTDWEECEQPKLDIPGLQEERDAANKIKREKPILVILGNPPYNAFAGTSPKEEGDLVAPYKEGLISKWGIRKFNLDDLYVRFFRMAENRVAKTGRGVVSFISNYSYTTDPTFVVMRQNLLCNFGKIWIDSLNGDSRSTGKKTPDGAPDPSVFSTGLNKAGIQVGTAIGMFVRTGGEKEPATVVFRNFWGAQKRENLVASLDVSGAAFNERYQTADPQEWNKLSFRPLSVGENYLTWPRLSDLCVDFYDGMDECRGGALSGIERDSLESRMRDYFDKAIDWENYLAKGGGLAKNAARFDAKEARKKALADGFQENNLVSYTMRPFDDGFCYYTGTRPVWNEPRPELWKQFRPGNQFLLSRKNGVVQNEGMPLLFTRNVCDRGALRGIARHIPFVLHPEGGIAGGKKTANLSKRAREYLNGLGFANPDGDGESAEALWLHSLAIGYSPAYQTENADGLKIDWPRVPLPQTAAGLKQSALLGAKVRGVLDMQKPFSCPPELLGLGVLKGNMDDLRLSDVWGYRDGKGKTYPGKGKTSAQPSPQTPKAFAAQLGAAMTVHINDGAQWETVPSRVWEFRVGGFQPAKKWLSYRAGKVLGRALTADEAFRFSEIVRRIAVLLLLQKDLNANYRAAAATPADWQR